MNNKDQYFMNLVNSGKLEVDILNGFIYSNLTKKRHLITAKQSAGYIHLSSGPSRKVRNYIMAHRLIWIVAKGDIPDGLEVNHINGLKTDNRINNLELVTRADNVRHAHYVLGKNFGIWSSDKRGTRIGADKKQEISKLLTLGVTNQSEISRITGVRRPTVNRIVHLIKP